MFCENDLDARDNKAMEFPRSEQLHRRSMLLRQQAEPVLQAEQNTKAYPTVQERDTSLLFNDTMV